MATTSEAARALELGLAASNIVSKGDGVGTVDMALLRRWLVAERASAASGAAIEIATADGNGRQLASERVVASGMAAARATAAHVVKSHGCQEQALVGLIGED